MQNSILEPIPENACHSKGCHSGRRCGADEAQELENLVNHRRAFKRLSLSVQLHHIGTYGV